MLKNDIHFVTKKPTNLLPHSSSVLLVHGAWHGAWCWENNFLNYFAERGFETHAMDIRGHGKSPAKKSMRWNRISDYVDDVLSVVNTFDLPPFVIGHSMGGYICQHLMRRTKYLAGVGMLATVPSYGVYKTSIKLASKRPLDFIKANLTLSLYPLVENPEAARHMFCDLDIGQKELSSFTQKLTDESYLGFLDMLFLDIPMGKPNDIPVMVVGGELDTLFPPQSQQWTASKYKNATCVIVPNTPHDVMLSKNWQIAAEHYYEWMRTVLKT